MNAALYINQVYYFIKPIIPRRIQLGLRRQVINYKRSKYKNVWPILESAGDPPKGWKGWPDQKQFAVVLTHDVELQRGHDRCKLLLQLEQSLGFKSLFNFSRRLANGIGP